MGDYSNAILALSPTVYYRLGDGDVGDDFNDNFFSPKWQTGFSTLLEAAVQSSFSETGNRFQSVITSDIANLIVEGRGKVSGDFDIQVDFEFAGSTSGSWGQMLQVSDSSSLNNMYPDNHAFFGIFSSGAGPYRANVTGGTAVVGGTYPAGNIGKLRMVRTGSTISFQYWDVSTWTELTTKTLNTNDVHIRLVHRTWSTNQTHTAYYDNVVVNSGTIVPVLVDEAGTYHGTYVNSPTYTAASLIDTETDYAVDFNGTTQNAISTNNVVKPTSNTTWTYLCSFKPDDVATLNQRLMHHGDLGVSGDWGVNIGFQAGGQFAMVYFDGVYKQVYGTAGDFANGETYHLVCVCDAGSFTAYVNNQVIATGTSVNPSYDNQKIRIGCRKGTANELFFNGVIDDFAFFDSALSSTNVADLYALASTTQTFSHTGSGGIVFSGSAITGYQAWPDNYRDAILALSPEAYYRLGELSGATVAVDETGNYNATYLGSPLLEQGSLIASDTGNTSAKFSSSAELIKTLGTVWNSADFSVVFNFEVSSFATQNRLISLWDDDATKDYNLIFIQTETDGNFRIFIRRDTDSNSAYIDCRTTTALAINTKYHVVLTSNDSGWQCYINGQLRDFVFNVGSTTDGSWLPTLEGMDAISVGSAHHVDKDTGFWSDYSGDPVIDDPAFFLKHLSATEASALYESAKTLNHTGSGGIVFSGSATTSYEPALNEWFVTGSGGATFSGSAVVTRDITIVGSSGITFLGSATTSLEPAIQTFNHTGIGGITFTGAATISYELNVIQSGGIAFSGDAVVTHEFTVSQSGGLLLSGQAEVTKEFLYLPSGGISLNGNGIVSVEHIYYAQGGVSLSGAASVNTEKSLIQTGSIVFSGNAVTEYVIVGSVSYSYTGSGGIIFSGSALTEYDPIPLNTYSYTPIGGITFSGNATVLYVPLYEYAGIEFNMELLLNTQLEMVCAYNAYFDDENVINRELDNEFSINEIIELTMQF